MKTVLENFTFQILSKIRIMTEKKVFICNYHSQFVFLD